MPALSRLFLEYQTDPVALRRYFPTSVRAPFDIAQRADEVRKAYEADRNVLCDSLDLANISYGSGDETRANIERLRGSDSVAILTGQQTGLFTGPLYSIYKALTAIRMAECLTAQGVNAVPVFWMATEDHDLEEISNGFVIDRSDRLFESRLDPANFEKGHSVGTLRFDASIGSVIDELFGALPQTEFSGDLRRGLSAAYSSGVGFGQSFGKFLTQLLGKYGLIIADPLDPSLKELAKPVYIDAISRSDEIVRALIARSIELKEAGYHAQVLVDDDYFPLFWHTEQGQRTSLRLQSDGTVRVKGEKTVFELDRLIETASASPQRFSPGVMLRPVVQDYMFPTLCYFGGSAEIAYFAQNSEVYRILGRPVTTILHRQSFTVVEPKHARTLEKYGLTLTDLFAGEDAIIRRVIDEFIDPKTAALFGDTAENINAQLDRVGEALSRLDETLADNLSTRRRKIGYHMAALQKKYYLRRAETEEVIGRRIRTAFTALFPDGVLQERVLNAVSFLDRFGPGFVDWVYDSIDLEDKGHRVVFI